MTDADGWIKHDGGPCPVPPGTWVRIRMHSGRLLPYVCSAYEVDWQSVAEYQIFAPVTATPDDEAFIRDTAARVLAGFAGRADWSDWPFENWASDATDAAEALAAKLKERKA